MRFRIEILSNLKHGRGDNPSNATFRIIDQTVGTSASDDALRANDNRIRSQCYNLNVSNGSSSSSSSLSRSNFMSRYSRGSDMNTKGDWREETGSWKAMAGF